MIAITNELPDGRFIVLQFSVTGCKKYAPKYQFALVIQALATPGKHVR
jgi:hypothetical protein